MIDLDLEIEGPARQGGGGLTETLDELALAIATAIAEVVPRRIQDRGDLAGQRVPHRGGRPYRLSGDLLRSATPRGAGARAEVGFRGLGMAGGRPGRTVANAIKAGQILKIHRVNLLALREDELAGIRDGVVHAVARAIGRDLPVVWSTPPEPATGGLADLFVDAMSRGRIGA